MGVVFTRAFWARLLELLAEGMSYGEVSCDAEGECFAWPPRDGMH